MDDDPVGGLGEMLEFLVMVLPDFVSGLASYRSWWFWIGWGAAFALVAGALLLL